NPDLFLEKYLQKARHVEVQVLLGDHGAGVGFVERECSVQRRHQKLVEETPSPAIGAAVRRRLQEVAVRGLQSLGYRNAGTVEFLFHDRRFTFNEVNARLQVEHPITEMVTGVDLVRQQLRVASGEGIEFSQSEMRWKGHAIECRINAEDPLRNFLPSPGRIVDFRVPAGSQIRVDAGVAAGSIVPAFYDPLIAKLVVGGSSRDTAVRRMLRSVDAFEVRGIHSTLPFHRVLLSDRDFIKGTLWTTMVDNLRRVHDGIEVRLGPKWRRVRLVGRTALTDDATHEIAISEIEDEPSDRALPTRSRSARPLPIRAPMPGRVVRVEARPGVQVKRGDTLLVLEAMKMQNEIAAPQDGIVKEVRVVDGDSVIADQILAVLEAH